MPKFLMGDGRGAASVVLIQGNERLTVTAREVWGRFEAQRITVPCIRCFDRGQQCTRNYPAGCKGHV